VSAAEAADGGPRIVLAGGGTAGHTSPLIATAAELRRLRPDVTLSVIGTSYGLENTVVPAAGLPLLHIPRVPMPRRPGKDLFALPFRLRRAVAEAGRILTEQRADVLLGFGGYVSTPAYLAARRRRVPIVIHEQNVVPGLANQLGARFANRVFTAFPDTPLRGAELIGLPLRRAITELDRHDGAPLARSGFGLHPELPTLLVGGGSQGAQSINAAVRGARARLLAAGVQVLHILGPKNLTNEIAETDPATGAVYRPVAYVDRMQDAYAAADLMLGRSGASTVLETAAVGLPAIFVPYPHGNGEQATNAAPVVAAGGGRLLFDSACTPDKVVSEVLGLMERPEVLAAMERSLVGIGARDAATVLARATLQVGGAVAAVPEDREGTD
jgi:UDP-N-acetylglucosamine--N-acetylmuramyl-(pentapeptide) pyrophosphoryl-undecaprenol N-acetylglucosamine transferase